MPRYEASNRFWEVALAGEFVTTTEGTIGSPGETTVTMHTSDAVARRAYDELVVARTKKSFQLVAAKPIVVTRHFELAEQFWEITLEGAAIKTRSGKLGSPGEAKLDQLKSNREALASYNAQIREKLGKHYIECGVARDPLLERTIINDPYDATAYSVYGDWLQAHGDPRGELIALQLANKAKTAVEYLDRHAAAFLGPLAEHVMCYDGLHYKPAVPAFTWKLGFIHAARMSYNQYWNKFGGDISEVLALLLQHPSGRFLTELTLMYNGDVADGDLQPLIDVLARQAPPTLRKLVIGDDVDQISWYRVGNLGELWGAVPQLTTFEIESGAFDVGTIDLPTLRRAVFKTGGLSIAAGTAIADASWPRIEHLEIYYGDNDYGGDCSIAQVLPLLERTDLTELDHLGLMNAMFADQICAALPDSKLLPQLRVLDLSQGILTDDGARALAEHAAAFAHLELLDVSHNYLSARGIAAVVGIAKQVITEDQRDDEGDPELRYVVVGE